MTAGQNDQLEAISFRAWPPLESVGYDGWVLRYAGGYLNKGMTPNQGAFLSSASAAQMMTPQTPIWANDSYHIGITWFLQEVDGVKLVSHGGGMLGQISRLLLVPEKDFSLAAGHTPSRDALSPLGSRPHFLTSQQFARLMAVSLWAGRLTQISLRCRSLMQSIWDAG